MNYDRVQEDTLAGEKDPMTQSDTDNPEHTKEAKLSRRDWILLPLLSLLTICLLSVSTELLARRAFRETTSMMRNCFRNDYSTGAHAIPNSVCWEKAAESSSPVEYRFNSCGHRAGVECGPKAPDVYRIVVIGSSVAMGDRVQEEKTFTALLPAELSQQTGRKVEVYNEGLLVDSVHVLARQFNETLTAKPDLILWILTPYDIEADSPDFDIINPAEEKKGKLAKAWARAKLTFSGRSFADAMNYVKRRALAPFVDSSTSTMLLHFLYQSQVQYVKSCLFGGDSLGYLRTQPSAEWQRRLHRFNSDEAKAQEQARAAGVPLAAVLVPSRPQAAIISKGEWPEGYDPYKLNDVLRSIVTGNGGTYIDMLPDFSKIPGSEQYYLPVDLHPNAGGHKIIADLLAKELTSGAIPALRAAEQSQATLEKGK
jgi:hypothetical protein